MKEQEKDENVKVLSVSKNPQYGRHSVILSSTRLNNFL